VLLIDACCRGAAEQRNAARRVKVSRGCGACAAADAPAGDVLRGVQREKYKIPQHPNDFFFSACTH